MHDRASAGTLEDLGQDYRASSCLKVVCRRPVLENC